MLSQCKQPWAELLWDNTQVKVDQSCYIQMGFPRGRNPTGTLPNTTMRMNGEHEKLKQPQEIVTRNIQKVLMLLVAKETPEQLLGWYLLYHCFFLINKAVKTVLYQGLKISPLLGVQGIYKKQCGLVIQGTLFWSYVQLITKHKI